MEVAITAFKSVREGEVEEAQGGQAPLVGNPPLGSERF
jgi:hypothetical protein